jgi:hypothetical protein
MKDFRAADMNGMIHANRAMYLEIELRLEMNVRTGCRGMLKQIRH